MNIKLIFVLPPKLNDYTELIHLFHNLPKSNAIDLANPEKFPDFYKAENSFDISHLNKQGAEIFTKVLVEEYLKIKT